MPGQLGRTRLKAKISAAVPRPTAKAAGFSVSPAAASALSFGSSSPGSGPASRRPPRSLSWLARMVTAMPQVKPTVTGCGMWRIKEPSLSAPARVSMTPERRTAESKPSIPNFETAAATNTMNAPAGPPI